MTDQQSASTPVTTGKPGSRVAPLEVAFLVVFIAALFFITWFRRHGMFWNDEVMGMTTVMQPTWVRVMQVWWSGVDSSGLFFYVFARPWLMLFGPSELSLHMWSAFFISLSFLMLWRTTRRFAPAPIVAFVLPVVFLAARGIAFQLNNGRTYGVLLFSFSLVAYAMLRTDPAEPDFRGNWPATLSFLGFLLLTGSHTLGILFWGACFAAFVLRDLVFRVFQPKLYVPAVLAALIVVPLSWKNILADIAMGSPTFWTPKPTALNLMEGIGDFSQLVCALVIVSLVGFLVAFYAKPKEARGELIPRSSISLYCFLSVFPFLLVVMFGLSLLGKSIFIERYLQPILVGDMLLLCSLLTRLSGAFPTAPAVRRGLAVVGVMVVVGLFGYNLHRSGPPGKNYMPELLAAVPAGAPVVITDTGRFIEIVYYENDQRLFLSPTDWKIQVDPDFGPGGASFLHEMEDWKSMGIYAEQIQPTEEILAKYPSFTLMSDKEHTLWFRRYIQSNPAYRWTELPSFVDDRIWKVERR